MRRLRKARPVAECPELSDHFHVSGPFHVDAGRHGEGPAILWRWKPRHGPGHTDVAILVEPVPPGCPAYDDYGSRWFYQVNSHTVESPGGGSGGGLPTLEEALRFAIQLFIRKELALVKRRIRLRLYNGSGIYWKLPVEYRIAFLEILEPKRIGRERLEIAALDPAHPKGDVLAWKNAKPIP